MHFLCLHGMGTNSRIFEMQTSAIRYALDSQHTYEYVDGAVLTDMAPGLAQLAPGTESDFCQYADESSVESCRKALLDLDEYIKEEGPFDGVIAFSQGAGLAASLMVHHIQNNPQKAQKDPIFRCGIFFSGGTPEDPRRVLSRDLPEHNRRYLSYEDDGELIQVPTAHIWGQNDSFYPTFGPVLSGICDKKTKEELVHSGGHEVPGAKDQLTVDKVARIIRRTIARAEIFQEKNG
ncbi:hypothetical protein EV356DRAFT_509139 [Viridothelium virens]|uniref:Serine hydrolase domain-containing protein n=1 Tax=Viridothelium virens TaxID=1048519 RepID=A0A6A6GX56_VIRVR|nr:hypothetical protein EV356DRAFT_509139 [Viridothelium virens]